MTMKPVVPCRNEPYSNSRGLDSMLGDSGGRKSELSSSWENIEPEPQRAVHSMFAADRPAPAPAPASASASAASRARGRRSEPVEDDSAVKKVPLYTYFIVSVFTCPMPPPHLCVTQAAPFFMEFRNL